MATEHNEAGRGAPPEQRSMPLMTRDAPVVSVDQETRTAQLVWTTGAPVLRYDWWNERYYQEELSLDPAHVRMGRLQSGQAPLLNTHSSWRLEDVLGVITQASVAPDGGNCTVRFSRRDEVEPIFQDVADGIVRNVSVGYRVYRFERIAPATEGGQWVYRAVDWEPNEVSLVPIGADPNCGVRSNAPPDASARQWPCDFVDVMTTLPAAAGNQSRQERNMPDNEPSPAAPTTNADHERALAAAREEGARQESERQAGIREAVRLGGLETAYADQLIQQRDLSAADAGMAVLREQARRAETVTTRSAAHIQTISDETDNRRAAMGDAIVLRANPRAITEAPRLAAARQYRGMDLLDMARECIELAGGKARGLSRRELATVALNLDHDMRGRAGMNSISDFPQILGNTVSRTLRQAYQLQLRTFTPWTRMATAPDFREIARVQLSESSALQGVKEGGEYKAVQFGESAEKYSLGKYGGIVAITWETLVNDDLGAFDRVPTALAAEAAALESDIVYGVLASGKMSDGLAIFHTNHGNLAGTAAAINETTLTAGRTAMRKQVGLKGRVLNLTPSFLIVGPDKEMEANKYTSAQFVAAKAGDINPNFNTSLEVVVEARIAGNAWHLAAAPGLIDTIEYCYLEGEEGLYTEQRVGFEVDGLQVKARHVFAAKAIDHRGLFKNPGA